MFSVSTALSLDKTSKDLRDKRLLTFDSDKLTRVELASRVRLSNSARAIRRGQILKPKALRADGSQVEDLVRKLKDAKMDTSVSDEDAKAAAAFTSGPVAVVNVADSGGTQPLDVRKDKDRTTTPSSAIRASIR